MCWVLLPIPFALLVIRFFVKKLYTYIKASQEQLGTITDFFVESVANMSLIKTFTAESQIIDEMQRDNIQYRSTQIKLASIRSTMFPFIATIGSIGQIIYCMLAENWLFQKPLPLENWWPLAPIFGAIGMANGGIILDYKHYSTWLASLNRVQDILSTSPHPQLHHPSIQLH